MSTIEKYYLLLPFFLYAETHYSFKGVYSRLKKKEPEVIADAPHRVEPNRPIPIMLLFKDSHKFPVKVNKVDVEMTNERGIILQKSFIENTKFIKQKFHSIIFEIDLPYSITGLVKINVKFEIETSTSVKSYFNDNYRISSHDPLKVYIAEQPLPRTSNWYFGDMHYHSSYTEDQAEFGAPLLPSVLLSRAMGLSFFAATDHSYDLDDDETDYLKNDPGLNKWKKFKQEVSLLNKKFADFVVLPGEEVSAGNMKNRNVHFLVINDKNFIPGKGDSAEKWFKTKPDLSIYEILNRIDDEAAAIAAHPEIRTPLLQWLLIRRGRWRWEDYLHDRLNGMQIWNGAHDRSLTRGLKRWVDLLLHGKKLFIFAGNDAHGNFNRFRQIGFPFWTFRELNEQIFGKMRTGLKIESSLTLKNIIRALKQGNCIITDGPFVEFTIQNEKRSVVNIGEEIEGNFFKIEINAQSTPEFGKLEELKIFYGNMSKKEEKVLQHFNRFDARYTFTQKQELPSLEKPGYLRLELISSKNGKEHRCFTNPVWLA